MGFASLYPSYKRKSAHVIDITAPPSARSGEPVMALASREQRNSTAAATSSAFASRLMIKLGRASVETSIKCTVTVILSLAP
jgi:hypothetical protein